jgi:hypothetical protein
MPEELTMHLFETILDADEEAAARDRRFVNNALALAAACRALLCCATRGRTTSAKKWAERHGRVRLR